MPTNNANYMRQRRIALRNSMCECGSRASRCDSSNSGVCDRCYAIQNQIHLYHHYYRTPRADLWNMAMKPTRKEIMWEIDVPSNPPGWGTLQELEQRLEQIHG